MFTFSMEASSCISAGRNFQKGYFYGGNLVHKTSFLEKNSCGVPINYIPRKAEPIIVDVLVDAAESGVNREIINKVLKKYNCVYSARDLEIYSRLKALVTEKTLFELCPLEYLQTLLIVNVKNGVILREAASKESKKIGTIANGVHVTILNDNVDWVRVKSYSGVGYIHRSLLTEY